MSSKVYILLLMVSLPLAGFCFGKDTGGKDTINQYDSAGKKNGYWVLYLTRYLNNKKDNNHAGYYRYTYYDHGLHLDAIGGVSKKWKLTHTGGNNKYIGTKKELDGTYTWKDNKGTTRAVIIYRNGLCCMFRWFYPSGEEYYTWNYTRLFRGQPHTYSYYYYDKHRNIKYYYFHKTGKHWFLSPGSKDEI